MNVVNVHELVGIACPVGSKFSLTIIPEDCIYGKDLHRMARGFLFVSHFESCLTLYLYTLKGFLPHCFSFSTL